MSNNFDLSHGLNAATVPFENSKTISLASSIMKNIVVPPALSR